MAPTMPNVIERPLDYAVWCFPHASPALTSGAGKQQIAEGPFEAINFLTKNWSGRGIRTLDPNLGKGVPLHIKGAAELFIHPG